MIWESCCWKGPLLESAKRLRDLKASVEPSEEELTKLERDIFVGFYSVRKLIESVTKITDAMKYLQVTVSWYQNVKSINWLNSHKIDELYDLRREHQEIRDLRFVAGRIIHSFIYMPYTGDAGGLRGIFFTSDVDRNKKLYALSVDTVIDIFERVGNDDPALILFKRLPDGTERTIVQ